MMNPSGGEIIPSDSGSGEPSHSYSWMEDSFSIGVLMEPFPETSTEGASTASADAGPVHNTVSNSTEGPASLGRFPYEPDELIGGDSVSSIQRRLLLSNPRPSAEEIDFARMQAEDLFEVKVQIIRQMEGLDPTGDWMRQGARALDSPNSTTGESSLTRLYGLLEDLERGGRASKAFFSLSEKVALRRDDDAGSSA
ncbi:putative mitochondrial protein AtMg01010 [Bidens hawaiensis]|uniref:putative mitochondrial protein AtMg01010 n=1 Tax=Bidens hawaiensis TaxID=980011 RepID=UPI00404AFE69